MKEGAVNNYARDFPDGPVVKNLPAMHGMWVRSLVEELRSHMPQSD